MLLLIGSYLVLVFVLPIALSAAVSYRALPTGRHCPRCGGETIPLVAAGLRAFSVLHTRAVIQRRWCWSCAWEGTTRVARDGMGAPAPMSDSRTGAAQTLDIRSLDVDGTAWRVLLQCWAGTGLFYGRLVFVGPGGQLRLDAVESFSGSSETEVLGQALALPDGQLAFRLRRLASEI